MAEAPDKFRGSMPLELFHMMAGDRIGQGIAREVYLWAPDHDYVIKFELADCDFQNVTEWLLWESAPNAARKWLAPCEHISPNGKILIQRRCTPWLGKPPKHPKWMDDMHMNNWGTYKGRPVAMDYGRTRAFGRAFR
jgi:hypothetical protein